MTTYGYARVSTNGQDPGSQEAELMAAYLRDNPCPYLHGVPMNAQLSILFRPGLHHHPRALAQRDPRCQRATAAQ